jgi:hypothetical protein
MVKRVAWVLVCFFFVALLAHRCSDDFDGVWWWLLGSDGSTMIVPMKSTANAPPSSWKVVETDGMTSYEAPATFIGSLDSDMPAMEVTRGSADTIHKIRQLNSGRGAPPTWYKVGGRIGSFVWLQNACLRWSSGHTTLYSAGVPRRDVISGGVWGPWKKTHLTKLEGLANLTDQPPGTRDSSNPTELEARWHPEHAILPWFRLKFDANNMYHAIEDIESAVRFIGTIEEHIAKCGSTTAVLLRQGLDSMHDSLEMRLFKSATGTLRAYKIAKPDSEVLHCFRGVWLQVKVPGLKPYDPKSPYRLEVDQIPIRTSDWRLKWQQKLGLVSGTLNPVAWDYCYSPSEVPQITVIQRLHSRRILNLDYVVLAMQKRGWRVNVVSLEGLSVDEQFLAMQNTTTLIAYHGAGLAWARLLPGHAAEVQVIGLPCSLESHSKQNYAEANRYRILHSSLDAVNAEVDSNATRRYCEVLRRSNIVGVKNRKSLTDDEVQILEGSSIFETATADVRKYDAILSIPDVIQTITEIDPVLSPPHADCGRGEERNSPRWKCADLGHF